MALVMGFAVMITAGRAMAAVEDCPAPQDSDAEEVVGDIEVPLPGGCHGVVVNNPLGPIKNFDVVNATTVVSGSSPPATDPGNLPDGMTVVGQQDEAEPQADLNVRQLMRLGELDAMQGKPLNMSHSSDLGYLQGYTNGQIKRQQGGNGGFGR